MKFYSRYGAILIACFTCSVVGCSKSDNLDVKKKDADSKEVSVGNSVKNTDELAAGLDYANFVRKIKSGDEQAIIEKADSRDAEANYTLGLIFKETDLDIYYGHSDDKPYFQGIFNNHPNVEYYASDFSKFFERAAELGNTNAQIELALAIFRNENIKDNEAIGFKWALIAKENGNKIAEQLVLSMELLISREQYLYGKSLARKWMLQMNNKSNVDKANADFEAEAQQQ